jgi:uncharacterized membrane protein YccC
MFAVVLAISLAGVAGPNATGLARALILIFVVSSAIPAAEDAIPARLLGLAIGGACAIAAALVLWPEHPREEIRGLLGGALDALAGATAALATTQPDPEAVAADRARACAALERSRTVALALVERPTGTGAGDIAARRLGPGLAQLEYELEGVAPPAGFPALAAGERDYLRAVAGELARAARALKGERGRKASTQRLATARETFSRVTRAELAGLLAHGPATFAAVSGGAGAVARAGITAEAVVHHATVAVEGPAKPSPRVRAGRIFRRIRLNLDADSVVLRNALRLAVGLAAARAVAGAFDLSHGFWVVFATLSVTRATARRTGATALRAVAGTLLGAAIATPILLVLEARSDVWAVLLPLLTFLAVYGGHVNFVLGQAGFTLLVVGLFSIVAPPHWDVGLIRLGDVVVGAALGLLIGLGAWPRGPATQLRRAIAAALAAAAAYERAVTRHLLGQGDEELAILARHAREAIARAEDVVVAYLGEISDPAAALRRWGPLLDGAWRRVYGCAVMAALPPAAGDGCAPLVEALDGSAARLENRSLAVADALARRAPPPAPAAPAEDPSLGARARACVGAAANGATERRAAAVALLACRGWIGVVGEELAALEVAVARLADDVRARRG